MHISLELDNESPDSDNHGTPPSAPGYPYTEPHDAKEYENDLNSSLRQVFLLTASAITGVLMKGATDQLKHDQPTPVAPDLSRTKSKIKKLIADRKGNVHAHLEHNESLCQSLTITRVPFTVEESIHGKSVVLNTSELSGDLLRNQSDSFLRSIFLAQYRIEAPGQANETAPGRLVIPDHPLNRLALERSGVSYQPENSRLAVPLTAENVGSLKAFKGETWASHIQKQVELRQALASVRIRVAQDSTPQLMLEDKPTISAALEKAKIPFDKAPDSRLTISCTNDVLGKLQKYRGSQWTRGLQDAIIARANNNQPAMGGTSNSHQGSAESSSSSTIIDQSDPPQPHETGVQRAAQQSEARALLNKKIRLVGDPRNGGHLTLQYNSESRAAIMHVLNTSGVSYMDSDGRFRIEIHTQNVNALNDMTGGRFTAALDRAASRSRASMIPPAAPQPAPAADAPPPTPSQPAPTVDAPPPAAIPDAPAPIQQHMKSNPPPRARIAPSGNLIMAAVDLVNTSRSFASGDTDTAMAYSGSALMNGVSGVDDYLAATSQSAGRLSRTLGPLGYASTALSTGVELYRINAEDTVDGREQQGQLLMTTGAGLGAALAVGAAVTTAPVVLAVGAASVAGYAASYAVSAGNQALDSALFGTEDRRFEAKLETKLHMKGFAGRFHGSLADKSTDRIDWSDPETLNRYEILLNREKEKQEARVKEHSSLAPRWMRAMVGSESLLEQLDAKSELQIVEAAQAELAALRREQHHDRQQPVQERMSRAVRLLDTDGDGQLTTVELDLSKDGRLNSHDFSEIATKLGNNQEAQAVIAAIQNQGIRFDGEPVGQPVAQSVPHALSPLPTRGVG